MQDPQDAVLELERRLAGSRRALALATVTEEKFADVRRKADRCAEAQKEAQHSIDALQHAAGANTLDELRAVIARSDRVRSRQRELQAINEALSQDGDGVAVSELTAECADVDLDKIAAHEQRIGEELATLRARLMEARDVMPPRSRTAQRTLTMTGAGRGSSP